MAAHVPPSRIFALATKLGAGEAAAEAERLVEAWVNAATGREILAFADAARSSFTQSVWPWAARVALDEHIEDDKLDLVAPRAKAAVAAVLSTHRSGYVRELGTTYLALSSNPLVIPFLVLRLDDIVPSLRRVAEDAVLRRSNAEYAPFFANALAIISALVERERSKQRAAGVLEFLARPECRTALVEASTNDDAIVRRHAIELLSKHDDEVTALTLGLCDRDTRVRLWAARTATSQKTAEPARRALLPALLGSRSPSVRTLALRAAKALGERDEAFEQALLDHHSSVRHLARAILRARHPDRAFGATRTNALRVLADANATSGAIIGALGAMADVGLASDVDRVSSFASDPRSRVRSEARRTVSLLSL